MRTWPSHSCAQKKTLKALMSTMIARLDQQTNSSLHSRGKNTRPPCTGHQKCIGRAINTTHRKVTSKVGHRKACAQGSPVAHAEEVVPLEGVVGVGQHEEMLRAGQFVPPHARVVLATVRSKVRAALSFDRICTARVALADAMDNMKAKAISRDLRSDTTTKTRRRKVSTA